MLVSKWQIQQVMETSKYLEKFVEIGVSLAFPFEMSGQLQILSESHPHFNKTSSISRNRHIQRCAVLKLKENETCYRYLS